MGFLKRIGKGLKKIVKGIGKGIKKVVKKIGGVVSKLGIVGQLGLMFLGVPPILERFFGTIGSFASNVIPGFSKLGEMAVRIKNAGTGVFNTITEAIGNGFDRVMNFAKGEGLTLSEGRTSVFAPKPEVDDLTKAITDAKVETGDISLEYKTPTTEERLRQSTKSILEPDVTKKTTVDATVDETGFFKSFKERITDPKELAKRGSTAALDIIQQRATVAGMEDLPTQMYLDLTPFMAQTTEQRLLDSTTWNGFNQQYQQAGAYGGAATGDFMTPYLNDVYGYNPTDDSFSRTSPQFM